MNASVPQSRQPFPVWVSTVVWLSAFLSPTVYFLLLLLARKFQILNLPATFVGALFFVIPVVALLICESVVWMHTKTLARKIVWMVVTLLGMLLQFAFLVAILRAILIAITAYAQ
ncbi:MAG TPA: hypothetical protein VJ063_06840 [Verrucomicrobiae bacterium]|nr:hypothetical protein [Verrucomicrobiae bacterium]